MQRQDNIGMVGNGHLPVGISLEGYINCHIQQTTLIAQKTSNWAVHKQMQQEVQLCGIKQSMV
jgi:hypothetical protein